MEEYKLSEEEVDKVWDILVSFAGAYEDKEGYERKNFKYHHYKKGCDEWRFQGKLGYGGKYRSQTNSVDCHKEDETKERLEIINQTNEALSKVRATRVNTRMRYNVIRY